MVEDYDAIAGSEAGDAGAYGSDDAGSFMAENAGSGMGAGGDFFQVRAADTAGVNAQQ